jgi:alpha-beta hydrolase superfamily lysophospholipase
MATRWDPSLGTRGRLAAVLLVALAVAACAQRLMPPGPGAAEPRLADGEAVAADGMALPLRAWLPDGEPDAVILALHGFNDYSKAFEAPGQWWAEHGIATYAYDQRGFGETAYPGQWSGTETMAADATVVSTLIAARHPGVPVYLLGESMGGAVALVAMTGAAPPPAKGIILVAPAVWARDTMPAYQRVALWIAARTIPWARFSGRGLDIQASDNIEMLRALGRDPLYIKKTQVSAMEGLADLMDAALAGAPKLAAPTLLLYGEKDQVIPPEPTRELWRSLPEAGNGRQRLALYENGWHLLLRDLDAETVRADIAAWIADTRGPLPSGAERAGWRMLAAETAPEPLPAGP